MRMEEEIHVNCFEFTERKTIYKYNKLNQTGFMTQVGRDRKPGFWENHGMSFTLGF